VVVGWRPTVSQFPPDNKTPETVKERDPKTGKVVVVAGAVVVVVVGADVEVEMRGKVDRDESAFVPD
jgi:hypothetical protein